VQAEMRVGAEQAETRVGAEQAEARVGKRRVGQRSSRGKRLGCYTMICQLMRYDMTNDALMT
jgi:hypothetical protein